MAEIAADFMTTFYHIQSRALETKEFRTTPLFLKILKNPLSLSMFQPFGKPTHVRKVIESLFDGSRSGSSRMILLLRTRTGR